MLDVWGPAVHVFAGAQDSGARLAAPFYQGESYELLQQGKYAEALMAAHREGLFGTPITAENIGERLCLAELVCPRLTLARTKRDQGIASRTGGKLRCGPRRGWLEVSVCVCVCVVDGARAAAQPLAHSL
jgi:hypothetical protein